jgi:TatD DNase family protein
MFDTHAHVHGTSFDDDREAMLARARDAGVTRIMTIGTDLADSVLAQQVAARYGLDYAIGIHPHEAKDAPSDLAAAFDELIAAGERAPRAIGEMGLDFYYDHSPRDVQRRVLVEQFHYARERGLPAIFHLREAFDEFVELMRTFGGPLRGVVHCFTGDPAQARILVDEFGLRLGIGGVLTFRNAEGLRDAVRTVGLTHLILETDCPYLAPVPHRGSRNEPAFLASTAARLAALFETSVDEVVAQTSSTAHSLFGA